MVYFSKKNKDLKNYRNDVFWFLCKPLFITEIVCIPFIVYFLIVGFLSDEEALIYAFYILALFAIIFLIIIAQLFSTNKILISSFNEINQDGNIDFSIEFNDDEYLIENITLKTRNRLKKKDIKKLHFSKKTIIIKTELNQLLFFPKTKELEELFK